MKTQSEDVNLLNSGQPLHFIGIGGSGMCGLAEIMLNLGCTVSGSDQVISEATMRLEKMGAKVFLGHDASHIGNASMVVLSAAIREDNPELQHARASHLVVVARADLLATLMRYRRGIAVAGSHGKTTTTSMLATLMEAGGLDPTYVVGGKLLAASSNGKLGVSDYLVIEADESDGTFEKITPEIAVVTNIDEEHLSAFDGNMDNLQQYFADFLSRLPAFGLAVICLDDPHAAELIDMEGHRTITYGLSPQADFRASEIEVLAPDWQRFQFRLHQPDGTETLMYQNMPGRHNISNLLAAVAVASNEGVPVPALVQGAASYRGVGRRLEVLSCAEGQAVLVSDYGHHPTEIRVCLNALKENWPKYRPLLVLQPHRYTRTQALFGDFVALLSEVEDLILLPTYSAGEPSLPGCDSLTLASAITEKSGRSPFCPAGFDELRRHLKSRLRGNDVVLFQGAGDIGAFALDFIAGERK